jgi:hypothetical protein
MHKTMAPIASIAMAFLCAGIVGCGTQLPVGYHISSLNSQDRAKGRVCMVGDQSCLSMMTEPPHACLIDSGHCDATGRIQFLDRNVGAAIEPDARINNPKDNDEILIDPLSR